MNSISNLPGSHGFLGVHMNLWALALASVTIIEVFIRAGSGVTRLIPTTGTSRVQRLCIAWLMGLALLGTTFLGLSLCGVLFSPVVLVAAAMLAVIGDPAARMATPGLRKSHLFRSPAGFLVALIAGIFLIGIIASPALFANAYCEDSLVYHFGLPWQAMVMHRFPVSNVSMIFHQSLPVDTSFVLAVVMGDDRLTKVICGGGIVTAGLFGCEWLSSRSRTGSPWLPFLLFLLAGEGLACAIGPKNDLIAASCFVIGGLLWRDRAFGMGGVILGVATACKVTSAPFILSWITFHAAWSRFALIPLAGVLLPVFPWSLKSYLVTGDPLYPAGWKLFGTQMWGDSNQVALAKVAPWVAGVGAMEGGLPEFAMACFKDYSILAIILPLLWRGGMRREIGSLLIGGLLSCLLAPHPRYLLPGAWMVSVWAGAWLSHERGRRGRIVGLAIPIAAVLFAFKRGSVQPIRWDHLFLNPKIVRAQELTTYGAFVSGLSRSAAENLLLVGGWRTYLIPNRILFNGYTGETPLVWSLVQNSDSVHTLSRRFRQLGITRIAMNIVSVDYVLHSQHAFRWNARMLRLYREFCLRHLQVVSIADRVDHSNGGFYLLRVTRDSPPNDLVRAPMFLPGAESALATAEVSRLKGDLTTSRAQYQDILGSVPDCTHFNSKYAEVRAAAGDWRGVYGLLARPAEEGYLDLNNLRQLGFAAVQLDRLDVAIKAFEEGLRVYEHSDSLSFNLAATYAARAEASMLESRQQDARRDLTRAAEILSSISSDSKAVSSDRLKATADKISDLRRRTSSP